MDGLLAEIGSIDNPIYVSKERWAYLIFGEALRDELRAIRHIDRSEVEQIFNRFSYPLLPPLAFPFPLPRLVPLM